ncbi:unnamed protein product [Phytophthora fragariaefolia]|uniref:Unnamed protein product n=1 Tax=Phytophthora fragariaefolia TaxID=1490495 RepID=A0A9W6X343_9STRA|nr:unnamed protein product [Phytophthora fragariaefolia]
MNSPDMAQQGSDDGAPRSEGRRAALDAPVADALAVALAPADSPESASGPRDGRSNVHAPQPPVALLDELPRPHGLARRSVSDAEVERHSPHDAALLGPVGSSNSASLDPEHVAGDAELLRQRLLTTALSTPVSGDAVSSRLLQALPQLALGQFLQDFNNQTPAWRNFAAAGRQDAAAPEENAAEEGETGRLLPSQPAVGGARQESPPRSRRRGNSVAAMYSMSARGEIERSDSGGTQPLDAANGESAPATRPTVRVAGGGRARRNSEDESEDQTAMDELQSLFRRCHNSLPFVALFLIYFAYQHATGILVFVVGTVAVMGLDQRMRAQVALKDKASNWHLLGIIAMCGIDMVAICSVDGQPNPLHHFSLLLQSRSTHGSDSDSEVLSTGGIFWRVLWTVLVNGTY